MKRKIIHINEALCNGCGMCAVACHKGAIAMVNRKATLIRDAHCDGLGDCLTACPTGAITFEEREALTYNKKAVQENKLSKGTSNSSRLVQWPCQIRLVPPDATYFDQADLLIAADCTAYAYASFHERFMRGRITLIGCPKLDGVDYAEKLAAILMHNPIKSVTVLRMEVPCCSGLSSAVDLAVAACGKEIPIQVVTISTDGKII